MSNAAQMRSYFADPNDKMQVHSIICVSPQTPKPPAPPANTTDSSPIRLRGVSDDLYIDRGQTEFKSTSQATASFTSDTHSTPTQTAKLKAALGYAFPVGANSQFIPFLSASQSVTDTHLKPRTEDPTNNGAVGFLASTAIPGDVITQVLTAKPQFLYNTTDQSKIASARVIYTPYTYFAGGPGTFNLNFFQPVPLLPGPIWSQLQFDLRNDVGTYTDRGNNPAQIPLNKSFDRAGTKVGLALTTDPNFPSLTLVISEVLMYGFEGSVRNINLFQTSLTYNFDSNNYWGLTAAYENGIDEDTALRVQTWTIGLSGRY